MQIRHIRIENFRGIKELDWHVPSDLTCIIGKGDSCKSTILDAIEIGLTPNTSVSIDDSDFYNMDVSQPVSIQISIGGFAESKDLERLLLSETNYGMFLRGYKGRVIVDEPDDDDEKLLTIEFWVDEELEPQWRVIAPDRHEPKRISKAHIDRIGAAKVGTYADWHFTWSKSSLISRLLGKDVKEVNRALASVGRKAREHDVDLQAFEDQAKEIEVTVKEYGVKTSDYAPKLDIQALTVKSGGLSLHDNGVPIKRHGTGTKRLIALALQQKLNEGKSIRLADEIEYGLEPHRISQVMKKIHSGTGQTFVTTHSPTVLREMSLENIVVFHTKDGIVSAVNLIEGLGGDAKEKMQGSLRSHAESFLSDKIIVCEGATEVGIVRSLNEYRQKVGRDAFSSLGIATLDAGSASKVEAIALRLASAGYNVGVFCDSDVPISDNPSTLPDAGANVFSWTGDACVEVALFRDLDKETLIKCIELAKKLRGNVDMRSDISNQGVRGLQTESRDWNWTDDDFRKQVGLAASKGSWYKSISKAQELGKIIFEDIDLAVNDSDFKTKLTALNAWCD